MPDACATHAEVPPGRFWELNVVRDCPVGQYRSGFLRVTEQEVIACLSCPQGWTTHGKASDSIAACNKLLPGYMVSGAELGGLLPVSINPTAANFTPPAVVACPQGYFNDGTPGVFGCKACPYSSVTLINGSITANDCMVPPGWYARNSSSGSGELAKCPTSGANDEEGFYRAGWAHYTQVLSPAGNGMDVCLKCGTGIPSEAADPDEHPSAAAGAKVAASASSCCESALAQPPPRVTMPP